MVFSSFNRRYLFENSIWDEIVSDGFAPYHEAPCHISQLNGYVLIALQDSANTVFFENKNWEAKFLNNDDLLEYKNNNQEIFNLSE